MKKYFLLFLAFLFVAPVCYAETYFRTTDSFVIAKAVKLGRGSTRYSSMGGQISKEGGAKLNDDFCSAATDRQAGLTCSNRKCVVCQDGAQCGSCPKNYVGDGKGGCRIQCIKGQADCELCSQGQIYDGSKCRFRVTVLRARREPRVKTERLRTVAFRMKKMYGGELWQLQYIDGTV